MRPVFAIIVWLWAAVGTGSYGLLHGCASMNAAQSDVLAATLNGFADTVPKAFDLAQTVCVQRQEVVTVRIEQHAITAADGKEQIAAIRADCDKTDAVFAELKRLHEAAKVAYRAGNSGELQRLLEQLRAQWQRIGKGSGS